MKREAGALAALLGWSILTIWVADRWAWSAFQVGIFALAGWRLRRSGTPVVHAALAPLAAAAVWPWAQLAAGTTLSRGATWNAALDWFTFLVVFALACDILSDTRAREWFLQAVVVFGAIVAAVSTLQLYSSSGKIFWIFLSGFTDGVLGPFVNRNQYAAWVELLLPVAAYLAAADTRRRTLFLAASAVLFGSVIASASRAGFVLAAAELVAVVALAGTLRLGWQLAGSAVVAGLSMGWQNLRGRLAATALEPLRAEGVRASLAMLRDRPFAGAGLGAWPVVYPGYAAFDPGVVLNQAHNDWAQWAAEGGLPFLVAMAVFTALLWKRAIPSIYGLGTVAFLVHALVDYPMQQRPALAAWFFAVAAAAVSGPVGNGLLRRARSGSRGVGRRNPAGVSPGGAPPAPRPLSR